MALVSLKDVMQPAAAEQYAVGAFNTFNEDFTDAIISAAKTNLSPVIISFSEVQLNYVDLECLAAIVRSKAERVHVPVVLHLDHGMTFETIMKALRYGFSSIMFDGSGLSFEENVAQTAEIVKRCKPLGVSVEAELGAIGGNEGGALVGESNPHLFTDVQQAAEFVHSTGVDALAVAIGNAHGKYKSKPELDFNLLAELHNAVEVPLVLHGGSGISDDDFRKAISLGIAKINFFTGMLLGAIEETATAVKKCGEKYNDYLDVLSKVKTRVSSIVSGRMEVFGSVNRARVAR